MKKRKLPTAEEIAEMADRGEDVTPYMERPTKGYAARLRESNVQRTNIDFALEMVSQLDTIASKLILAGKL